MTDPKPKRSPGRLPTAEELAAQHAAMRATPGAQEAIRRVNAESRYTLMVSRASYTRGDRKVTIHATRHGVLALCARTPADPMCIPPDGKRAVTCTPCLDQMSWENDQLAERLGYKGKTRKRSA